MVLIIKKAVGKRKDIILIPKRPLFDMLERHVLRKGLAKGRSNTCIVRPKKNWMGIPNYEFVVQLIINTVKEHRMLEGENRYPIEYKSLIKDLRCLDFDAGKMSIGDKLDQSTGKFIKDIFEGDFVINLVRIRGRGKAAIKEIMNYEQIGMMERLKLKHTFKKVHDFSGTEMVFMIKHIHPARRR